MPRSSGIQVAMQKGRPTHILMGKLDALITNELERAVPVLHRLLGVVGLVVASGVSMVRVRLVSDVGFERHRGEMLTRFGLPVYRSLRFAETGRGHCSMVLRWAATGGRKM
jgi:hypothetical protein